MSDHVVYVDRFRLREGKLEDFKRYATEMAEFVEKNEPGAVSFNYYVDEDGAEGTAVFVFSDAEALDVHLDVASSRFQEGYELLSATDIELLGRPQCSRGSSGALALDVSAETLAFMGRRRRPRWRIA